MAFSSRVESASLALSQNWKLLKLRKWSSKTLARERVWTIVVAINQNSKLKNTSVMFGKSIQLTKTL